MFLALIACRYRNCKENVDKIVQNPRKSPSGPPHTGGTPIKIPNSVAPFGISVHGTHNKTRLSVTANSAVPKVV